MKRITVIGVALVAVLALGVMAASASAAPPEFLNSSGSAATGATFTATSGAGTLKGTEEIKCEGGSSSGTISGASTVSSVLVDFTGCYKGTEKKESTLCHSKGQTGSSILTVHLSGSLGSVETSEAASGVGLLLAPASGTEYTSVEHCTSSPSHVTGSVIGEVTPVNTLSSIGHLIYEKNSGNEKLQKIMSFIGGPEDKLTAFGPSAIKVSNEITFSEEIKVN